MPSALIADDEAAPRAQWLGVLRSAWPELQVVQECANGVDAWDAFLNHSPEVCFLDVRMPGLTGIEVAQRIGTHAHIVFVTTPGDHAISAFDAAAVDYVQKPVDPDAFAQVIGRVQARLAAPGSAPADLQQLLNRLARQVRKPAPLEVIQASIGHEVQLVRVEDVVYFEADTRHTRVVHAGIEGDGEVRIRTPFKELVAQLDPAEFWQVNRSVIVNRHHIARAERAADNRLVLRLTGRPERLPVSAHFEDLFSVP